MREKVRKIVVADSVSLVWCKDEATAAAAPYQPTRNPATEECCRQVEKRAKRAGLTTDGFVARIFRDKRSRSRPRRDQR